MNSKGKYIIWLLIVFVLIYTDGAKIIPGMVWKIPLFLYALWYDIKVKPPHRIPTCIKTCELWGVKNFFNMAVFSYFMQNVTYAIKFSMIPVIYGYVKRRFDNSDKLFDVSLIICQFLVLVNIPFFLGIIQGQSEETIYEGFESFFGAYSAAHTCAITVSMSSAFIFYKVLNNWKNKKARNYNLLLYIFSFLVVYRCFTRTGWLMFAVGFICVLWGHLMSKNTGPKLSKPLFVAIILLAFAGVQYFANHNQAFYNRINDITTTSTGEYYQGEKGSGREIYSAVSLAYWLDGDALEKTIGYGMDPLMDNMKNVIGYRIYSHNGFVDALVGNGIIGVVLLVGFCLIGTYYTFRRRKQKYGYLALSCILMYTIYQAVQGGSFTYQDVVLALALALIDPCKHHQKVKTV